MAKNLFERTERAPKHELKGQAALVLEALDMSDGPASVEDLTKVIVDLGLVTRQLPERITSYYLCIFKKQGLVRVVKAEEPAAETKDDPDEVGVEEEELAEV